MQFSDADIKKAGSKNLAGYVIAYRLLGVYKELSILCMEELMNRRANGDIFDFEEYIENELKDAPKPNDLKKVSSILKGLI
jgi:hypothetical protein